jgi:DNA (cytosine-5)-methyltransferase 1
VAENVGGLFSADDGVALARCIRELLDSGACETGWRLLDSQYFGVAQRRKRVFIVSDFGGESVDEILAITESLPGHPPPSREAGKGTAGDATKGVGEGGKCDCDPNGTAGTLLARDYKGLGNQDLETGRGLALQAQSTGSDPDLMATLCAKNNDKIGSNQWVKEGKAIIEGVDWYNNAVTGDINHTLKIGGDVPGVIEQKETYCLQGGGETSQSSQGSGVNKDVAFTLNGLDKHGVAYEQEGIAFEPRSADGEPRITGDIKEVVSPTLNCMGGGQREPSVVTSQQGGEGVGVAFHASQDPIHSEEHTPALNSNATIGVTTYEWHNQDSRIREQQQASTLSCNAGGKEGNLVRENLTVRRLTPVECERLQGFPDNWTSEKMELTLEGNEWKATGKVLKQADGPRYKAMGNAVTVNVAEWIGKQIGKVIL